MLELLATWPAAYIAVALVFGLLLGSFLNVVIYRLPVMLERQWRAERVELAATAAGSPASALAVQRDGVAPYENDARGSAPPPERFNLAVPRSVCPTCRAPIKAIHNVPILSYLLLRGRCASCRAHISLRYPAVELLCGVTTALVAWHFGLTPMAACAAVVTWFLIALAGIDLDHQLLPDSLTLPLLWMGLLASLAGWSTVDFSLPVDTRSAIEGAAAGYLALWAVYHAFRLLTGKEGMGYGDFKLLAALGAWMGWRMLLPIVLLAAVVGALVGGALILSRRQQRGSPMPFGPFLAAAGWIAMLWGPQLVTGYLGLYAPPRLMALCVGLTGGIASGKSTVAMRFGGLGAAVIDADQVSRELMKPGTPIFTQVLEHFAPLARQRYGAALQRADGTLNRSLLRRLVFDAADERRALETLLHPAIRARMDELATRASAPYQLHVVPLLVESRAESRFDRVLVVDCPEALQLERLMARDGIDAQQAQAMLAAQVSRAARLAAADDIIVNDADPATLDSPIRALDRKYRALAQAKDVASHP